VVSDDIVTRLRKQHTIQYGWKLGELVKHTEHNSDPQIRDRMNRCEVCEQWSPCDGIKAADEIERLREAGDALAQGIRTGKWDDALDAWTEVRGE
jgi:hypothetical protein